jgi:hypothetical protein
VVNIFGISPLQCIFRAKFHHKFKSSKLAVCHEFMTAIFASKISNSAWHNGANEVENLSHQAKRQRGIKMHNANLFIYIHWSSSGIFMCMVYTQHARSLFLSCLCCIGPQLLHQHICIIKYKNAPSRIFCLLRVFHRAPAKRAAPSKSNANKGRFP